MNYRLTYKKTGKTLKGYTNSDRDGFTNHTGFYFILEGTAIFWKNRKQQTAALSTMEAEYMAMSDVVKKAIF